MLELILIFSEVSVGKSIQIIDELIKYLFLSSRFQNKPLFSNLDKLPQKLKDKMQHVTSDELKNVRKDCL